MPAHRRGLFFTFEGGEGAGKSTQAAMLTQRMEQGGLNVLQLREPGGTPLGDYLREWLKSSRSPLTPEAELFLFVAARAELVRAVIQPALDAGTAVVLDRYADSTTVYQGMGRRLDRRIVAAANRMATGGLQPDLTVLLDLPPVEGLQRAAGRDGEGNDERRFEEADLGFHRRVRQGFLRLAKRSPERWLIVDATLPVETVAAQIWERARQALPAASGRPAP
ncbi:MAG: dTMP kinase [Dehalococcoidia bacterium]